VVADIPGLIEGAHEGKGLGIQFLPDIERTQVLVYLIDCTSETVKEDFKVLVNELKSFNEELRKKRSIVALTKADIAHEETKAKLKKLRFGKGISVHIISAVTKKELKIL